MKYIVLTIVIFIILLAKPWEINFAGGTPLRDDSTLLKANAARFRIPLTLYPIGDVICNKDSDFPESDKIDRSIERFMRSWSIKGASFALMKDGKLIYSKGYGYADEEADIKTDVQHVFRIASVSKLITAVGIMKLQEEGKLQLSDRVFGPEGILNDSVFLNIKDRKVKKVTVENLLRHQAGFAGAFGDPMFSPVEIARKMHVPAPADLTTLIQYVLKKRLHYYPGTSTLYSNIGYGILTKVIEKVSGMGYENYIRTHVLQPAGCYDMYLGNNLYEDRLPHEVRYYESSTPEMIPACDGSGELVPKYYGGNNVEGLYGAGGWVASASELLRFLSAIDGDPALPDILQPETITQMTAYAADALPIGWMHVTPKGEWWRSGTLSGTSVLLKKQADGYAWAFITNTSNWKGPRFPSYINQMVTTALKKVSNWPEKNLFDLQHYEPRRFLVSQ